MKKWMLLCLTLLIALTLVACGSEKVTTNQSTPKENSGFTKGDIEKVNEMLSYLNEKMNEFEATVNESIQNGELKIGDNDKLKEKAQDIGQKIVIKPFLDKYPNSLVSASDKEEIIPITIEADSSESCAFGNCTYDEIKVLDLKYNTNNYKEYYSENFKVTQLIFDDAKIFSKANDDEVSEETEIRFVKTKNDELILTSIPYIQAETLYMDEYDNELESIKTTVPESEVEAEQAEYKGKVQETLEKFPKLQ